MRLICPLCGERDRREFYYAGHAVALNRPSEDAGVAEWDDYMHTRDNPCGQTRDLWYHEMACGAWIVVTRDTASHEVLSTQLLEGADA